MDKYIQDEILLENSNCKISNQSMHKLNNAIDLNFCEEKIDLDTRENIKRTIILCVADFNGLYGRSGIAKILKGSKSLKDNEHNNASLNSKYFGALKELTLPFIVSIIDELIKEGMLFIKKVSFARPVLCVKEHIVSFLKKLIKNELEENSLEEDDENIQKISLLIKEKKNIFITGHAGTGKSYILRKIKKKFPNIAITSTTGIAAVNIKGQTLHSWAGVGICNKSVEQTVEKIMKKKPLKKQIKNCKILAIDEISMLDIKTFEYVDLVFKRVRKNKNPFGGIQVIFIGDFFQLPPVEKDGFLKPKYCFESKLWQALDLNTVLLTKNYRQNEQDLINALANMRINSLTQEDIALLKTREHKEDMSLSNILHIFATNWEADNYNSLKFKSIKEKEHKLVATDGIFKGEKFITKPTNQMEANIFKRIDTMCNAEKNISLKVGARVMLLVNLDFERGLINGSCGNVMEIKDKYIKVDFDNGSLAQIEKHDFEFYNNEVLIAKRRQFPLRLAYGITIHKSQGMSLDKLVVDCSRIFEKGQIYVALSRIKTLKGLYLRGFNPNKVMVDSKVVEFYKSLKA